LQALKNVHGLRKLIQIQKNKRKKNLPKEKVGKENDESTNKQTNKQTNLEISHGINNR
jgi:hypothetical protein